MKHYVLDLFYNLDSGVKRSPEILEEIRIRKGSDFIREYSFNVVDITLDFEKSSVVMEDITDVSPEGKYEMSLEEFEAVLVEGLQRSAEH